MTRKLPLLAAIVFFGAGTEVRAQFYGPSIAGVQYNGGRVKVVGYVVGPAGMLMPAPGYVVPYTIVERRIIVQPFVPSLPPRAAVPEYDLSGIDLDVESPDRLYPPGAAPKAKPPQLARPPEARLDMPKKLDEPAKPAVKPEPPPPPPPPAKPPIDDLLQPRAGAVEESQRLVDLGTRAFRAQQYGVAALRYRQATEMNPTNSRAFFLLGQAYVALGQLRDAVRSIQDGLRLRPDWPIRDFRPRTELYAEALEDWAEHRRRVDDAVKQQPQDSGYLFLRAYVAWFHGQRREAVEWFQQARPLAADPRWVDLFLVHVPGAAVAAQ
jgi:hypothetical protein